MAQKIFLLIFTLLGFLLLFEVSLRLVDWPYSSLNYEDSIFEESANPIILYKYKLNFSYLNPIGFVKEKNLTGVKITNSYGMRNVRDFRIDKKNNNTFRIVVLGDSVTGPQDMLTNRTYPWQLESLLDQRNNSIDYTVLNFGVSGYSIRQELEVLKTKALSFNPDLIIMGYVMNDPIMTFPGEYFRYKYFKSFTFLMSKFKLLNINRIKEEELYERIYDKESDTWKEVVTSLEEFKKISDERNIKIIFLLFPLIPDEDKANEPPYNHLYNQVINEAGKYSFVIIDLFDAFNNEGFKSIRTNDKSDNVHYNSRGNFVVAREIIEVGVKENIFSDFRNNSQRVED